MTADLDLVRRAANQMRELADQASPGPWSEYAYPVETATGEGGEEVVRDPDGFDLAFMTSDQFDNCSHIAKWDPVTALAVADSLDDAAADLWAHGLPDGCTTCGGCDDCDDLLYAVHVRRALAVARAFLKEDA